MMIVPAVLATTEQQFREQCNILLPLSPRIQIDIADGLLVPNTTVSTDYIVKYLKNNKTLFQNHTIDFHLMVQDWESVQKKIIAIRDLVTIGLILIHKLVWPVDEEPKSYQCIVYNPSENIDFMLAKKFHTVQIMTIIPGEQGGTFLPDNLPKIAQLKKKGFQGKILLDGGINSKTLPTVLSQQCLPDMIAVGSYLTTAHDPKTRFARLEKIMQQNPLLPR
ncbi:MAG: hypothetical protein NUV65_03700 [Candidatus Roizmanbacteria bacterium]|nr:hypothetical protein [Candidatus Roizmanbacteria bacterium]